MELIVSDLVKLMKREQTILGREKAMMTFFYYLILRIMQEALVILDEELAEPYKKSGFKIERRVNRTVTFLFGVVSFKRRRMVDASGKVAHPLDEFLGIKKGSRFSTLVLKHVAELSTLMVYRHVSKAVELLTPLTISHQKAQSITRFTGDLIDQQTSKEERFDGYKPKKSVPVLYIEGDGIQIKGKGKKKLEIHRYQVFEERVENGKRATLVGTHYVSSLSRKQAQKEMTDYLHYTYDLTDTTIVSTSDGGSGYEASVFEELGLGCRRQEHFRDPYHVNRKIKERFSFCPSLQTKVIEGIRQHDWERLVPCFDTAESLIEESKEEQQQEQVDLLKGYLKRNWAYLKPLEARKLSQFSGKIGTCEANHRRYTYRMKRQGRYWSEQGATAMIRVIDALRNNELDDWLNTTMSEQVPAEDLKSHWEKAQRFAKKKVPFESHVGVLKGRVANYGPSSTVYGKLSQGLNHLTSI